MAYTNNILRAMCLFANFLLYTVCLAKHIDVITTHVHTYNKNRGVTILEIGADSCLYVKQLSKNYNATGVMMYMGVLQGERQYAFEQTHPNMVILNPLSITVEDLETLVRCEHFDVVIVHGVPSCLKKGHPLQQDMVKTIDLIAQLGDHTYIELGKNDKLLEKIVQKKGAEIVSSDTSTLYYLNTPKKGLDIARWNCRWMPWQKEVYRYPIYSDFEQKYYQKKETAEEPIGWLKGINLATFVMLRGICPGEATIEKSLTKMRSIKHNDLIIGNMIVQGKDIVVIDFDDPRWNGNVQKCITAALTVFDHSNMRLRYPAEVLRSYRLYLEKMNKQK